MQALEEDSLSHLGDVDAEFLTLWSGAEKEARENVENSLKVDRRDFVFSPLPPLWRCIHQSAGRESIHHCSTD